MEKMWNKFLDLWWEAWWMIGYGVYIDDPYEVYCKKEEEAPTPEEAVRHKDIDDMESRFHHEDKIITIREIHEEGH